MVAEGDTEAIRRLIEFLKIGPPFADVKDLEVSEGTYTGEFSGFSIRR